MRYSHSTQNNMFDYLSFIENQLSVWPLAKQNYDALRNCDRRRMQIGDYNFFLQFNPARAVSTGADISKSAIASRPCFLCKNNRPEQQIVAEVVDGFDLLVNPFPIFPVHFTGAAKLHQPQTATPLEMVQLLEKAPDLVCFFNGAHAGASAPDHLHFQAVLKCELPLLQRVEQLHNDTGKPLATSNELDAEFPLLYLSYLITPDTPNANMILATLQGAKGESAAGQTDPGLVNTYMWLDNHNHLRALVVYRKAHRPSSYGTAENQHLISPGAVDMAGVIITPRLQDFNSLTADDIRKIYSEVSM